MPLKQSGICDFRHTQQVGRMASLDGGRRASCDEPLTPLHSSPPRRKRNVSLTLWDDHPILPRESTSVQMYLWEVGELPSTPPHEA